MLPFVANAQSKEPACNIGKSLSVVKQDETESSGGITYDTIRDYAVCVTPPPDIPRWCQPAGFAACARALLHHLRQTVLLKFSTFLGGRVHFSKALQQADFLRRDEAAEKDPTRDASPPLELAFLQAPNAITQRKH